MEEQGELGELDNYLNLLFSGLEGYVYAPVKKPNQWEQKFFEYPSERQQLSDWITANALDDTADVYISPAVYSQPRATKDCVKGLRVAWVEFDGQERIAFPDVPIPTAIVQTSSSTHVHAYWAIGPQRYTTVEDINRRLTYHLGADSSGWDATQLLRPPSTFNRKHNLPVGLQSLDTNFLQAFHPLESFDAAPVVPHQINDIVVETQLRDIKSVLDERDFPLHIRKMIKVETPVEPYRSSFLSKIANFLAEEELTYRDIVSVLYYVDQRVGKYKGRSDELVRLSQIADYALAKHLATNLIVIWTPREILRKVENLQWIIPQWLHTTSQLVLSSAPGVGKTQLSLQMAYMLSEGKDFLGITRHMSTPLSTLYISLEMDITSLKYILEHQQHEWEDIKGSSLSNLDNFHIIDEPAPFSKYESIINDLEVRVVFVDSLTEMLDDESFNTSVDYNSNQTARYVMKWCRKIRRRYGCAVILIHHNRKATEGNKKPKGLSDLAGSFQFGKDSDTVVQLWEDHRGLELSLVKCRFGPKTEFFLERNKNLWYSRKIDPNDPKEGGNNDSSDKSGPNQPHSPGDGGFQNNWFGH